MLDDPPFDDTNHPQPKISPQNWLADRCPEIYDDNSHAVLNRHHDSDEDTNGSFSIDPHDVAIALARSADPAEPTDRTSDEHNDTSHAELIQLHGSDTCPKDGISTKSHDSAFILTPGHERRIWDGR